MRFGKTVNTPADGGRADGTAPVFFAGVPLGHEFTSLVLALLQAGGHPSKEEQALQEQAKSPD